MVNIKTLDVKRVLLNNGGVAKVIEERDHVDCFLEENELPGVDLEVEGIVDRINGLRRRFHRMLDETLAEFGLNSGEWKALNQLYLAGPPYRRSVGEMAAWAELSSGAMTNRVDRLEQAGLVKRVPDPSDRRGVLVELTAAGQKTWEETVRAGAANEALIAAALSKDEKRQLNALLRRLMLEFERREQHAEPS
jgi:DNA-binding MarR family transcriptional regulator